jgi:hypothetical protein
MAAWETIDRWGYTQHTEEFLSVEPFEGDYRSWSLTAIPTILKQRMDGTIDVEYSDFCECHDYMSLVSPTFFCIGSSDTIAASNCNCVTFADAAFFTPLLQSKGL